MDVVPEATDASVDVPPAPRVWPMDDVLRLHHVQLRGTHNSYHVRSELVIHPSHDYDHAKLAVQLEDLGIRALELDLHLGEEGFEVYHLSFIDEASTCKRFADCLTELRDWSAGRPDHLPVVVWLELKDAYGGAAIEEITLVESAVTDVIPAEQLLIPDEVRGEHGSVREALQAVGWPTLGEVRGQLIFVILSNDERLEAYTNGYTSLAGRSLFVRANSDQFDQPWAAFGKTSDPDAVLAAHAGHLLVATNTCSADEDDASCAADLASALASGHHMLKDDVPAKLADRDYYLDFPGGAIALCNPVTAPQGCTPEALEGALLDR